MDEFTLDSGRRVDLLAVGRKGEIWVVECKSSRIDFVSDTKWKGYLDYCDRYFWAVDMNFPFDLLPGTTGLIVADQYDAEILRMGEETKLAAARRKSILLKFARNAADRLHYLREAAGQQQRETKPDPTFAQELQK